VILPKDFIVTSFVSASTFVGIPTNKDFNINDKLAR